MGFQGPSLPFEVEGNGNKTLVLIQGTQHRILGWLIKSLGKLTLSKQAKVAKKIYRNMPGFLALFEQKTSIFPTKNTKQEVKHLFGSRARLAKERQALILHAPAPNV